VKADTLRKKFIDFFVSKGHKQIPSASLIPEDDATILFTPAGMSPLVRYLMGENHPLGKRLCSIQKCLRTDDIDHVGDLTHFTFFEMMGNWSLGDYFKRKAIEWSFEFIYKKEWLGFNPKNIYVTVFEGDKNISRDNESIKIWMEAFGRVGIKAKLGNRDKPDFEGNERIFLYDKSKNWWGPVSQIGPCGPDTEIFYDTGKPHNKKFGSFCHPNCDCGRFFEFWNNVFMQYKKKIDGSFEPLKQKNVDTGMGFERVIALTEFLMGRINNPDPFLTPLFYKLVRTIEEISERRYEDNKKHFRIIADHLRASVFIISTGVIPSNKDRGYILRRLIRRVVDAASKLKINQKSFYIKGIEFFSKVYSLTYAEIKDYKGILSVFLDEVNKYNQLISKIEKKFSTKKINAQQAFRLFTTFGLSPDQLLEKGYKYNQGEFRKEMKKHQNISRKGMKQKFKGGLQNHSKSVIKLHTVTHLLHQSLRQILGDHVKQAGSNITQERLRFDFTHSKPLLDKELVEIENLVNKQIRKNLRVTKENLNFNQALKQGALAFFNQKYPDIVKVYDIGNFSKEICGGPHVSFTGVLGKFIIKKEESCGAGKRRIYAVLKP